MKGTQAIILLIAVAAAVMSVVALVSDGGGGPDGAESNFELTYSETGGSGGSIPLGDSGTVNADNIGLGEDGEEVGGISTVCLIVTTDDEGSCSGTATLPDGELILTKTGPTDGFLGWAIVGGTGEYLGAHGTFAYSDSGAEPTYTFDFTTP